MARRMTIGFCLLLAALFIMAGCGVKTRPVESTKLAPRTISDLAAVVKANGVELSFSVPRSDNPRRRVEEIRIYYAYLPLTGDPACPPCAPRLRKYRSFDLTGSAAQLMKGGRFIYLDKHAPLGKEAIYRVLLIDASGRKSALSNQVRVPRVVPPEAPTGLEAETSDAMIKITWLGEIAEKGEKDGHAGYVVYRKGPGGDKQLNVRPLREPFLVDRTVQNGMEYTYRVAAVRRVNKALVQGKASREIKAAAKDAKPPAPPSDLLAMGLPDGIMLRFSPSKDQDTKGYLVYRAGKKDGDFGQLNQEPVIENLYRDTGANPKKVYFYRVAAVDEAGNISEMSETLEYKPQPE